MAITSIKQGYTGVGGGGDDNRRDWKEVFTVTGAVSDSGLYDWPQTSGSVTIPGPGTPHGEDASLISGVPRVEKRGPGFWRVEVPYATRDRNSTSNPQTWYKDPLDEPAAISWGGAERSVPYDIDRGGMLVVNALGMPFTPPPTREICDTVLVIERNEATWDDTTPWVYAGTTCSETFYGRDAGIARMMPPAAHSVAADTPYWRCRYEVHFREDLPTGVDAEHAWWRRVLDLGYKYKDAAGKVWPTEDGKPCLLAADGTKTTPGSPHVLFFQEYIPSSWSALGLDPTPSEEEPAL